MLYEKRLLNNELLSKDELAARIRSSEGLIELISEKTGYSVEFMKEWAEGSGKSLEEVAAFLAYEQVSLEYCEECYSWHDSEELPDPYEFYAKYWLKYTLSIAVACEK